jgi:hypothetical protein
MYSHASRTHSAALASSRSRAERSDLRLDGVEQGLRFEVLIECLGRILLGVTGCAAVTAAAPPVGALLEVDFKAPPPVPDLITIPA